MIMKTREGRMTSRKRVRTDKADDSDHATRQYFVLESRSKSVESVTGACIRMRDLLLSKS